MEQNKALEILVNAVQVAQKRGAFELAEAKLVAEAVEVFVKKPEALATPVEATKVSDEPQEETTEDK
jgi:hypothetical protein